MQKSDLRKSVLKALRDASEDGADWASFSFDICKAISSLPEYERANVILCYRAMKYEPDMSKLIAKALSSGKRLCFPVCQEDNTFKAYEPNSLFDMKKGPYGISEPDEKNSSFVSPGQIDLIIAPGLAFDINGVRLGHGAGYYDKYLRDTRAFRLGVCSDMQLLGNIPFMPHDEKMHMIITEARRVRVGEL